MIMMMKTRSNSTVVRALILLGAALVLGALGHAIRAKEHIKRDGEVVYLELAPVDPRSLMQGDYMALRFRLAQDIDRRLDAPAVVTADLRSDAPTTAARPREGELAYVALALDERRVATLAAQPASNPLRLRYRMRHGGVWLGTNAFFFREGESMRFSGARYGEFRVDRDSGEAVLVGLRGEKLAPM